MEFQEKLRVLRKNKGFTQDELAQALFISRTAVSKWESGRGLPNIESLKAIAEFFEVTVDELISGDQLLSIAEKDTKQRENHIRDLIYGLMDCSTVLFLFLPLFRQKMDGNVLALSLFSLTEIALFLRILYISVVSSLIITGIGILALQNCQNKFWLSFKTPLSLFLNIIAVTLFIVSLQPYAAVYLFVFLVIKLFLIIKCR